MDIQSDIKLLLAPFNYVAEVKTILQSFEGSIFDSEGNLIDRVVESTRGKLLNLFKKSNGSPNTAYSKALHKALLRLAETRPINQDDPVYLFPVDEANRIVVSTGHQFDILSLFECIRERKRSAPRNLYFNILTNEPFHEYDIENIVRILSENHCNLCDEPAINPNSFFSGTMQPFQREMLERLSPYGVSETLLRSCNWLNSSSHLNVFEHLVRKGGAPDIALQDMHGLDSKQLAWLRSGLTRDEILGTETADQRKALLKLKNKGLLIRHFRGKSWFNSKEHLDCLEFFLIEKKIGPEQALDNMEGVRPELLQYFRYKLSKQEILALSDSSDNHQKLFILSELKNEGLTVERVLAMPKLPSMSEFAFVQIIKRLQKPFDEALAEVEGFNAEQIRWLSGGYARPDISELNNLSLLKLKTRWGMTSQQVKKFASNIGSNSEEHLEAAVYLVEERKFSSCEQVRAELNGIPWDHLKFVSLGLSKEEILEIKESMFLEFYAQYQAKGLTLAQLRILIDEMKTSDVIKINHSIQIVGNRLQALSYLIDKREFEPEKAIAEVSGLSYLNDMAWIEQDIPKADLLLFSDTESRRIIGRLIKNQLPYSWLQENPWFNSDKHVSVLLLLVNKGYIVDDALEKIRDLSEEQLDLLMQGFPHIDIFRENPWFNNDKHVIALTFLLEKGYEFDRALSEMKGLSEEQLDLLMQGFELSDIRSFKSAAFQAIEKFKKNGLTLDHFKANPWLNDEFYLSQLEQKLSRRDHSLEPSLEIEEKEGLSIEEIIQVLEDIRQFTIEQARESQRAMSPR